MREPLNEWKHLSFILIGVCVVLIAFVIILMGAVENEA